MSSRRLRGGADPTGPERSGGVDSETTRLPAKPTLAQPAVPLQAGRIAGNFLAVKGLQKRYDDGFLAVRGVDLAIAQGEFVVLLGPSGCGKTTTLRCIAGLEIASAGSIHLGGKDVTTARPSQRDVGMVFQFYALYPHLSVRENLLFPLKSSGMRRAEREQRLAQVVARLHLESLLDRSPRQLAGGDQQRVSLARAMIRAPQLWLMDEPLGTIDGEAREYLRGVIRSQQLEAGVTTVYVTHDQEEAMTLADRVVVMDQGRIRQIGTPAEIYENPADLFVADFVGSPGMNRIAGVICDGNFHPADTAIRLLPAPAQGLDGPLTCGIRSEYLHLDDTAPWRGTVMLDEYLGAWRNLHLNCQGQRLIMRTPPGQRHAPGTSLGVRLDAVHALWFGSDGLRLQ